MEKANSIFAKGGYTDKEAERNILANPFKRFEDMQMLRHTKTLGIVQVDKDQCIICVVGDMTAEHHGYCAQVLDALKEQPVRMICYGGSDHNVSVLVSMQQKQWALQQLSKHIFGN